MYNNKKKGSTDILKMTSLIPNAISNGVSMLKKTVVKSNCLTTVTCINYPNGLQLLKGVNIPKCATKAQYREFLPILVNNGYSVKDAAEACKMSTSYAYKLLKHK